MNCWSSESRDVPHTIYVESRQQKNKAQQRSVKSEQRSVKSEQIIAEDSNEGHSSDHCSLITDNSPKHLSVLCSLITHGVLRQQLTRHALQRQETNYAPDTYKAISRSENNTGDIQFAKSGIGFYNEKEMQLFEVFAPETNDY